MRRSAKARAASLEAKPPPVRTPVERRYHLMQALSAWPSKQSRASRMDNYDLFLYAGSGQEFTLS